MYGAVSESFNQSTFINLQLKKFNKKKNSFEKIDDVTLANHMESGGIPGSVHISHETYINLTGIDQYHVVEGNGAERSSFLKEKNVTTYLIKPKVENESNSLHLLNSST
jgi:hypothetical protein